THPPVGPARSAPHGDGDGPLSVRAPAWTVPLRILAAPGGFPPRHPMARRKARRPPVDPGPFRSRHQAFARAR
ncbi:hypothetical protein, partial [Streptomyces sp. S3(2020)]|uniref:hypothetical protein n=1 Tax=Streptomyces sp. S3(2020) TaxID=2732044 RepID=UPI0019D0408C